MRKIIKHLWCIILGICMAGSLFGSNVYANASQSETNNVSDEVSGSTYLSRFYEGMQVRKVEDINGNDVTDTFLIRTQPMYENGDEEGINAIIRDEGLVLHIYLMENKNDNITTFGLDKYKNVVSDMFYFVLTSDNGITLVVESELKGGIWYDEASGEVKRTTNATYNIIAMSTNTNYSITANDFATGSSVSNGKGYFWGRCSFIGQMTENGVHYYANFGSKQVSFYATA